MAKALARTGLAALVEGMSEDPAAERVRRARHVCISLRETPRIASRGVDGPNRWRQHPTEPPLRAPVNGLIPIPQTALRPPALSTPGSRNAAVGHPTERDPFQSHLRASR
jgi:hypothetical protein